MARDYEVHPTQIAQWKRELRDHAGEFFQSGKARNKLDQEAELRPAYEQIGRLQTGFAWFQKKLVQPSSELLWLIDPELYPGNRFLPGCFGQRSGRLRPVDLLSFMDFYPGYIDQEEGRVDPVENPFVPKVLPMSSV